jgi:hypothetical protein
MPHDRRSILRLLLSLTPTEFLTHTDITGSLMTPDEVGLCKLSRALGRGDHNELLYNKLQILAHVRVTGLALFA